MAGESGDTPLLGPEPWDLSQAASAMGMAQPGNPGPGFSPSKKEHLERSSEAKSWEEPREGRSTRAHSIPTQVGKGRSPWNPGKAELDLVQHSRVSHYCPLKDHHPERGSLCQHDGKSLWERCRSSHSSARAESTRKYVCLLRDSIRSHSVLGPGAS